jgi:hypothetical protein
MDPLDLPIVCTLNEAELRERRRTVLDSIRASTIDVTETEEGYAFRFEPTSDVLARLSNLVDLERQCCAFLTFRIVVEPQQPIKLEVTGPAGSKEMIADFLGGAG